MVRVSSSAKIIWSLKPDIQVEGKKVKDQGIKCTVQSAGLGFRLVERMRMRALV